MRHLRESIQLFRYRTGKLLLFELLIHFVALGVLLPFYYFIVNFSIRLAGIRFLSKENVHRYLKQPATYALFLVLLFVVAMFMVFHVSAVISYLHDAARNRETGVLRMLRKGFLGLLRALRPRNLLLIPLVYFYLPVSFSILVGMDILNLHLPSYVGDVFRYKGSLRVILMVIFLLLNLFFLRNMSIFHAFSLERRSFTGALRESAAVQKKSRIFGWSLFWTLLFLAGTLLIRHLFVNLLMRKIFMHRGLITLSKILYQSVTVVMFLVFWLFALPLILSGITVSYEGFSEDAEEEEETRQAGKRERIFISILLIAALILNSVFFLLRHFHVFSLNAEYMNTLTITAHRGDSLVCPENTLAAFRSAVESGADVIELDVRQTRDGVVVVSHDENIRRVAGVSKKIGNMTYEELMTYSAGKVFGKGYEEEPFPTLEEAIAVIDGDADLNIELKPAKTDTDMIRQVVNLVETYGIADSCVITSQNYDAIRQVKLLNADLKTVYVMSVAMGDFVQLKYADAFSIKYTYINSSVVKNAHRHGKKVYAWTVDSTAALKKMMMLHVDSIITNRPFEMRQVMLDTYYSNTLYDSLGEFFQSLY